MIELANFDTQSKSRGGSNRTNQRYRYNSSNISNSSKYGNTLRQYRKIAKTVIIHLKLFVKMRI